MKASQASIASSADNSSTSSRVILAVWMSRFASQSGRDGRLPTASRSVRPTEEIASLDEAISEARAAQRGFERPG
jgi:hypothetical protein